MITVSQIQRELKKGSRVSLIGKDIVSAFNHLRHTTTLERVRMCSPENLGFCRQFLTPRYFQIYWDGQTACMPEGTPQGSPLLPVLWLLFIARTLERVDKAIRDIQLNPRMRSQRLLPHDTNPAPPPIQVDLMSYADDINPVVITRGTSKKEHSRICDEVNERLEEAAAEGKLSWYLQKDNCLTFGEGPLRSITTLGIIVTQDSLSRPGTETIEPKKRAGLRKSCNAWGTATEEFRRHL